MNPFAQTRDNPDKPAIIVGEETMSYRELDLGSRAAASSLRRRGLKRGDVIAILAPNAAAFFVAAWAAQRSGLYYTPIGRHLKPAEIAYILGDSGARALFVENSLAELAAAALQELPPGAAPACFGLGGSVEGMAAIDDLALDDADEDVEGGDLLHFRYDRPTKGRQAPARLRTARLGHAPRGASARPVRDGAGYGLLYAGANLSRRAAPLRNDGFAHGRDSGHGLEVRSCHRTGHHRPSGRNPQPMGADDVRASAATA